jgi:hypothetical protein
MQNYLKYLKNLVRQNDKKKNIALVTANIGSYDSVQLCEELSEKFDCFLFTDSNLEPVNGWNIIKVDSIYKNPRFTAKIFKIVTHKVLPEYDSYIWFDSNMLINGDLYSSVLSYLDLDLVFFEHNKRKCIYDEIRECIKWGKDSSNTLSLIQQRYLHLGVPKNLGLYNCGFFIRNNTRLVNDIFDAWWIELCHGSIRDQISFPYVLWNFNIKPSIFVGKINNNAFFKMGEHDKYLMFDGDKVSRVKSTLTRLYISVNKLIRSRF